MVFVSRESYAHRCAKQVLCGWLRGSTEVVGRGNYAGIPPVSWSVNRDGPEWGVHMEYAFTQEDYERRNSTAWDERTGDSSPSFDKLTNLGHYVLAIADVVIQHKGRITAVFEVVWKHPLSAEKIDIYRRVGVHDIFEIDAFWILEQTEPPSALCCTAYVVDGDVLWQPRPRAPVADWFLTEAEKLKSKELQSPHHATT